MDQTLSTKPLYHILQRLAAISNYNKWSDQGGERFCFNTEFYQTLLITAKGLGFHSLRKSVSSLPAEGMARKIVRDIHHVAWTTGAAQSCSGQVRTDHDVPVTWMPLYGSLAFSGFIQFTSWIRETAQSCCLYSMSEIHWRKPEVKVDSYNFMVEDFSTYCILLR